MRKVKTPQASQNTINTFSKHYDDYPDVWEMHNYANVVPNGCTILYNHADSTLKFKTQLYRQTTIPIQTITNVKNVYYTSKRKDYSPDVNDPQPFVGVDNRAKIAGHYIISMTTVFDLYNYYSNSYTPSAYIAVSNGHSYKYQYVPKHNSGRLSVRLVERVKFNVNDSFDFIAQYNDAMNVITTRINIFYCGP